MPTSSRSGIRKPIRWRCGGCEGEGQCCGGTQDSRQGSRAKEGSGAQSHRTLPSTGTEEDLSCAGTETQTKEQFEIRLYGPSLLRSRRQDLEALLKRWLALLGTAASLFESDTAERIAPQGLNPTSTS